MMHPNLTNLYEPIEGTSFLLCARPCEKTIEECFISGEYDVLEDKIMKALFDYRLLNHFNLKRAVGRGEIKHCIKKLVDDGMIEDYRLVDEKGERVNNSLVLYRLSDAADSYYLTMRKRGYRREETLSDLDIYKTLSVSQYHISMLAFNKKRIRSQHIFQTKVYRENGSVYIPSEILLKNGVSLFAIPMAREKSDLPAMFRMLLKLSGYLKDMEEFYPHPFLLFLCPSNRIALSGMEKLREIPNLYEFHLSYVLDYHTKIGNPLYQISYVKSLEDGKVEIDRVLL